MVKRSDVRYIARHQERRSLPSPCPIHRKVPLTARHRLPYKNSQKKKKGYQRKEDKNKDIINRRKREKTTTCIDLYRIADAALQKAI